MIAVPESALLIGKYPVTQALWTSVMPRSPAYFHGDSRPVERVSWLDCVLFCNKLSEMEGREQVYLLPDSLTQEALAQQATYEPHWAELAEQIVQVPQAQGYRLLTSEEWYWAARANQDVEYAGSDDPNEVAWYNENSEAKTHPVGQKQPNGFGLYDMSGNVWEWCWDSTGNGRLLRGGSWRNEVWDIRIFDRAQESVSGRFYNLGFRLARTER